MSTPVNTPDSYGEILRLIPREPQVDMLLDLTVEESNAVQWANAYYLQLKSDPEEFQPVKSEEPILSLFEEIQNLIPTIYPENPTDEFKKIYGENPEMCRTYKYFNEKIQKMLGEDLTRAKTIDSSVSTAPDSVSDVSTVSDGVSGVGSDSLNDLDRLALAKYESESTVLDKLALKLYESKPDLDQLALAQFESGNIARLDQLALEKYRNS